MMPFDRPQALVLRQGGAERPLGAAHHVAVAGDDIRAARRQVVAAVAAGLFRVRAETSTVLEFHFRSMDDWTEFRRRPKTGEIAVPAVLLEEALAAVRNGDGLLVGTEATLFGVYEKLG